MLVLSAASPRNRWPLYWPSQHRMFTVLNPTPCSKSRVPFLTNEIGLDITHNMYLLNTRRLRTPFGWFEKLVLRQKYHLETLRNFRSLTPRFALVCVLVVWQSMRVCFAAIWEESSRSKLIYVHYVCMAMSFRFISERGGLFCPSGLMKILSGGCPFIKCGYTKLRQTFPHDSYVWVLAFFFTRYRSFQTNQVVPKS